MTAGTSSETILEVACFNPESAIVASKAGADRIELCDRADVGGTTPPYEWLLQIKRWVTIPVFVMIRPRGGDFVYTAAEFDHMRASIEQYRHAADGFVFGVLHRDGTIDVARTAALVTTATAARPCTFHRAFDLVPDPSAALEVVIAAGCRAVLTAGGGSIDHIGRGGNGTGHGTDSRGAFARADALRELVRRAAERITIVPGGGVRAENLTALRERTHARVFHTSGLRGGETIPDVATLAAMRAILRGSCA